MDIKTYLIATLLFFNVGLFAQKSFGIKPNPFPANMDSVEWVGTSILLFVEKELLVNYNNNQIIIDGCVVYRKYFNLEDKTQIYWDIDYFADDKGDRFLDNVTILGFLLDEQRTARDSTRM